MNDATCVIKTAPDGWRLCRTCGVSADAGTPLVCRLTGNEPLVNVDAPQEKGTTASAATNPSTSPACASAPYAPLVAPLVEKLRSVLLLMSEAQSAAPRLSRDEWITLYETLLAYAGASPVAWRWKAARASAEADWRHVGFEPANVPAGAVVEPLYLGPAWLSLDAVCLTIQMAVADYTRRTPAHLRDCDVLTGHIVRYLRSSVAPKYATPLFSEADRIAQHGPQAVSPPSTTPRSGATPRVDALVVGGADCSPGMAYVFAEDARQLERELAAAIKAHADFSREVEMRVDGIERALPSSTPSATPQKYDFLHDDRFTGAFIEQFIEEWMAPAAFANHDEQVFLNFAVALAHDLVHGPFDEFCAKVPIEQHLPNNRADGAVKSDG